MARPGIAKNLPPLPQVGDSLLGSPVLSGSGWLGVSPEIEAVFSFTQTMPALDRSLPRSTCN